MFRYYKINRNLIVTCFTILLNVLMHSSPDNTEKSSLESFKTGFAEWWATGSDWWQSKRFEWRHQTGAVLTKEQLEQVFNQYFSELQRDIDNLNPELHLSYNPSDQQEDYQAYQMFFGDWAGRWLPETPEYQRLQNQLISSYELRQNIGIQADKVIQKYNAMKDPIQKLFVDFYSDEDRQKQNIILQQPTIPDLKPNEEKDDGSHIAKIVNEILIKAKSMNSVIKDEIAKIQQDTNYSSQAAKESLIKRALDAEAAFTTELNALLDSSREYFNIIYKIIEQGNRQTDWTRAVAKAFFWRGEDLGPASGTIYYLLLPVIGSTKVIVRLFAKLLVSVALLLVALTGLY